MEIITGIILLLTALRMRSWGRKRHQVNEMLRPRYQNSTTFWFIFSVTGIAFLITGAILIVSGLF